MWIILMFVYLLGFLQNLDRRSEIQTQIEKLTTDIIKTQSASVSMHKEDAINLLLGLVMEIEPRMHPNYRVGATV